MSRRRPGLSGRGAVLDGVVPQRRDRLRLIAAVFQHQTGDDHQVRGERDLRAGTAITTVQIVGERGGGKEPIGQLRRWRDRGGACGSVMTVSRLTSWHGRIAAASRGDTARCQVGPSATRAARRRAAVPGGVWLAGAGRWARRAAVYQVAEPAAVCAS